MKHFQDMRLGMKRVFLTGGNGFIGRRFREAFHHDFEILSTDVNELNILERDKVKDALNLFKPDFVIHAAAIALTDFCNQNPEKCRAINVDGAVNVAEACRQVGARMVFLSSEQVFNGNTESGPYNEDAVPLPDTQYGKNKLEAEGKLKEILDELWILRFTWMFGVPERERPVVANILWDTVRIALRGEKVRVPRWEFRGLTYEAELMDQFGNVFDLPYGTYHIGSENELDRFDVVSLILDELGLAARIPDLLEPDESKYAEKPRDARLDTSRIKDYGFRFSKTPDAIRRCIREYNLSLNWKGAPDG
jgi:dTDP-4-dehydrorhamnose reductase